MLLTSDTDIIEFVILDFHPMLRQFEYDYILIIGYAVIGV